MIGIDYMQGKFLCHSYLFSDWFIIMIAKLLRSPTLLLKVLIKHNGVLENGHLNEICVIRSGVYFYILL